MEVVRIAFVLPGPLLNGGVRVAATYARRLQERGHDVVFVLHSNRRLNLRSQVRSLVRGDGWPSMHPDGEEFFRDLGVPQIEVPPTGSLDDIPDGDVIIATWWRTAELVAALGPSKGAKVYFLQHYESHPALPLERVKNTWRLPFHKVVVHRWLADVAAREYGDHFVSVVPNSVDTELFDSPPRGKQPVPTVGTMYSDARFKGSDIAFEAIRIARKSIPNLRVLSFGATKAFQRIDVPPGTEFHRNPPQARIRDIYSRCDAWLFASRSEGFGLPILEAMACRTPVIGTPAGAAPDYLSHGCGCLVPHEDPQAMADAIVEMAAKPEREWLAMSEKGYLKVRSYTWDDATDLFEQALYTALDVQSRRQTAAVT
jgi:glycosyltransferase involved in cell wall biosynthesis